jgi:hypothetical protein
MLSQLFEFRAALLPFVQRTDAGNRTQTPCVISTATPPGHGKDVAHYEGPYRRAVMKEVLFTCFDVDFIFNDFLDGVETREAKLKGVGEVGSS